ncbi:MAG: M23 family metallopeptidase [Nostoc sp. CmiVER01]|uniref:M23 family metallopeptidase n=1 Tax=Nostoc sp. CmiVER01 TaxID=3075384 RepID=UPI002AD35E50|nr:peptidoglycan DD-metalloendopeptidase family protein [Nostoc sp. CmiVER01]MDZ8126835.1 peptidoglycan DD-metalloendopeptidase family protein [Nostoc sp. CmiVER01]
MLFSISVLLATHLIVPIIFIVSLWIDFPKSQIELFMTIWSYGSYILFIFLVGNWSWFGYYLRYLFLFLFAIATIKYALSFTILPLWLNPELNQWSDLLAVGFVLIFFMFLNLKAFKAHSTFEPSISLSFPLKQGTYYVAHGGNSSLVNSHYKNQAQRFALDIVKLNLWGIRARGLYPSELNRYEIFDNELYSPCDGEIVNITNELPDNIPPLKDDINLAGNKIVIKTDNYLVVLAHIRISSIIVTQGELINKGQLIAKVGNSGNTTEPHLHIHAVQGEQLEDLFHGIGVLIIFDGRFLVRNSLVKA